MKLRSALILASFLSLAGCISTEEPGPLTFPEEPIRRERPAPELVPEKDRCAPVESWKAELAKIAPAGWTVGDAVDQLEAPDGWSRLEGGRGISFTISCKEKSFTLWLMPRDWKGKNDRSQPVRYFGSSPEWRLFYTEKGHAGWEKPEKDVAKAFNVTAPRRG